MARRQCGSCGKPYEAKTARSRFCSTNCRVRASRGVVVDFPTPPTEATSRPATATGLAPATAKELESAERLDTTLGQAALALARRIDSGRDTGSAIASMTRELRATLAEAVKGAVKDDSPIDELRRKRYERRDQRGA